jgi:Sulfotransferase family
MSCDASNGDTYFLDKSPPYCLIAEEIMRLFPEGKFIFLWRNPLSVIASLIDTWGPWRPTFMSSDLFIGLPRLVAAYEKHRDRVHTVRFEGLSAPDEEAWRSLMSYLEIEFEPTALTDFSKVELQGRMGDPTGRKRYSALSSEPGQKWRRTLASPIRREWCRRYLRFLGTERLAVMGYDLDRLLTDLDSLPRSTDSLGVDLWEAIKDLAKEPIRVRTRTRRIGSPHVIRELLRA